MKRFGTILKELPPLALFAVCFILAFSSCKKDKKLEEKQDIAEEDTTKGTVVVASREQLTADSLFLYAKDVYLWNESLPTYEAFNPRSFVTSDEEAGLNAELQRITSYAINPETGKSYEYVKGYPNDTKYSYIFDTNDANPVAYVVPAKASVDLEGNGYDIGIQVGAYGVSENSSSYLLYVQAVYPNSPAEKQGIVRGDLITNINGSAIGSNFDAELNTLNNTFYGTPASVTLKGTKRNGSSFNVTLSSASYRSSPVYCDSVYQSGSKKIGYLAYARFSNESNSNAALAAVFDKFASENVTDLIIDLRYNGGGYVSTAQYLANLIAPQSLNGSTMFSEHYNSLMQTGKASILSKLPLLDEFDKIQIRNGKIVTYADLDFSVSGNTYKFSKEGGLNNVKNVVFIVTGSTASASELVINSLRPHINVKIVGEQSYGKPVGFFPIRIHKYDVYYSMFESQNSEGQGKYYSGFIPDKEAFDDPRYLWGDINNEESIKTAYNYLVTDSFPASSTSAKVSSTSSVKGSKLRISEEAAEKLPVKGFKGMIEDRLKKR